MVGSQSWSPMAMGLAVAVHCGPADGTDEFLRDSGTGTLPEDDDTSRSFPFLEGFF